VSRYQRKRPPEEAPGAIFTPDGHVFGHIRGAKHLTISCVARIPAVADEECGRPLGGVSVIVSQNMRIGLQEESNIGVVSLWPRSSAAASTS
jgi:hypothetical protein